MDRSPGYSIDRVLKAKGVGRFQVMALLQAVRYYILYGSLDKAKSFGLNRAIFYAWAKHYGPGQQSRRAARIDRFLSKLEPTRNRGRSVRDCPEGMEKVLGECVGRSRSGFYTIGGREQKPSDFDREVYMRLKGIIDADYAWNSALEYVSSFPRSIIENPQKFYKYVYEPIRDTFFAMLARGEKPRAPRNIIEKFKSLEEAAKKSRARQKNLSDFLGDKN